jgi:Zn-dependent protease with chaperone function
VIPAVAVTAMVSVAFASGAAPLGRRLPPALAARVLVAGSVTVALSVLFVLAVVAFTWIGRLPVIAALGPWSPAALRRQSPVPVPAAAGATLLLAVVAVRLVPIVVRRSRALVAVSRSCRRLPGAGALVVVDSDTADAFTTPQRHGRIVVTTGLLRALAPAERRVVLAHEAAHLEHRHPWWLLAAELAAVLDPLLAPTARAAAQAIERWADEDAARAVADRRLAARTLARTALLARRGPSATPGAALGVLNSDVPGRVHALLAPPPRRRPAVTLALVGLVVAGVLAAVAVQQSGERLFEHSFTTGSSAPDKRSGPGSVGALWY